MTDAYTWSADSRPRAQVRIDVRRGEDKEVSWSQEEPTPEQVADSLTVFERLAGLGLVGGAS